ncbi:AAA family ATPase [Streptomyces sp. NBC_00249]|uniref:AAA family ATPase n=1 Tax=Streptomyces sp. NBC_00249 TaxID=2975690 RepID=UPI00225210AF|nr:AAA family ATPase [Streptomyces sp. NBC_00249]MCX5197194.1 AAA family ATPase [Streptomyces sp. NBC_00249]
MENVRPFPHQADRDGDDDQLDAERFVLGTAMNQAHDIKTMRAAIQGTSFQRPAHEVIWTAILALVDRGDSTHYTAVIAELDRNKELRRAGGITYITRVNDYVGGGDADHWAGKVREAADLREEANVGRLMVQRATAADAEPGAGIAVYEEFAKRRRDREERQAGPTASPFLDWASFFATDFGKVELLPGRLLAPGQQIAIVGEGKAGKSLIVQEWLWRMATGQPFLGDRPHDPVPVLYIDAENGHADIQARLISYGASPDRMGQFTYASFPPIRPLDTPGGGQDLLRLVEQAGAEVVCLDTVSRFISGPENDADTWLALYRCSLLPLKRAGKSSVRLDHLGKDAERGARGSSAKTQDVDHVWELRAQGGGALTLKRTYTRTGIGPDHFSIVRQSRQHGDTYAPGGTRHILMTWDTGTPPTPGSEEDIIQRLDAANVPADAGNRVVRQALQKLQISAGNDKIARIVRARQQAPSDVSGNRSAEAFQQTFPGNVSRNAGGTEETAGQTFPGTGAETPGTPPVPPASPPEGGNGEGNDVPSTSKTPLCAVCGHELHGFRLDRGYDTCLACDPTTGSHPDAA